MSAKILMVCTLCAVVVVRLEARSLGRPLPVLDEEAALKNREPAFKNPKPGVLMRALWRGRAGRMSQEPPPEAMDVSAEDVQVERPREAWTREQQIITIRLLGRLWQLEQDRRKSQGPPQEAVEVSGGVPEESAPEAWRPEDLVFYTSIVVVVVAMAGLQLACVGLVEEQQRQWDAPKGAPCQVYVELPVEMKLACGCLTKEVQRGR
ncbi:uncharacterized protein LOC134534422 [Bacillus rossius redtenbacheri]|uniref:uncharacterized protein LOC134534422 n=1 Tax=Bacillus rossius redtenbacheri TaxID=93214 RepID=UPI002FDEA28B